MAAPVSATVLDWVTDPTSTELDAPESCDVPTIWPADSAAEMPVKATVVPVDTSFFRSH